MWGQLLFAVAMLGALGAVALGSLSLAGLILDIVGVVLLAREQIQQPAAMVKYLATRDDGAATFERNLQKVKWYKQIILRAARRWGSSDVRDMEQDALFESFPINALGLILLALGFALQGAGSIWCR